MSWVTPVGYKGSSNTRMKPVTVANESHDSNPFYNVTLSSWFGSWSHNFGDAEGGAKFSLYAPWFATLFNSHSWIRSDDGNGLILGVNGSKYYFVQAGDSMVLKNGGIPYYLDGTKVKQVYQEH